MQSDEKLDIIISKIESMESEMAEVKLAINSLDNKVESYHDDLKNDISEIHLMMENEIRPSINLIAEGHRDLYRNFKEAQKPMADIELLGIRVNILETEVGKLKKRRKAGKK